MAISNKKKGTAFEQRFAQLLADEGFWVHLMTQNDAGQPADVIAAKKGRVILVDCKVCEKGFFRLDRIEDNQENAMTLWRECGNGHGWFALELPDGNVYMLTHEEMANHALVKTILSRADIEKALSLKEWVTAWK